MHLLSCLFLYTSRTYQLFLYTSKPYQLFLYTSRPLIMRLSNCSTNVPFPNHLVLLSSQISLPSISWLLPDFTDSTYNTFADAEKREVILVSSLTIPSPLVTLLTSLPDLPHDASPHLNSVSPTSPYPHSKHCWGNAGLH